MFNVLCPQCISESVDAFAFATVTILGNFSDLLYVDKFGQCK